MGGAWGGSSCIGWDEVLAGIMRRERMPQAVSTPRVAVADGVVAPDLALLLAQQAGELLVVDLAVTVGVCQLHHCRRILLDAKLLQRLQGRGAAAAGVTSAAEEARCAATRQCIPNNPKRLPSVAGNAAWQLMNEFASGQNRGDSAADGTRATAGVRTDSNSSWVIAPLPSTSSCLNARCSSSSCSSLLTCRSGTVPGTVQSRCRDKHRRISNKQALAACNIIAWQLVLVRSDSAWWKQAETRAQQGKQETQRL